MRWLPSISFSSSAGASSSPRSSPSKSSAEDISVRGSSAWRFVYRGKTSAHKKHRHHLADREVVSSTSSAVPRLSESHFRSSSGYDKLPARFSTSAIPQPLPLPELSHVLRRKEVSASGASVDVDQHLPSRMARPSRGTEERAATAAVDISSTNAPIQSIFTIREKRLSGVTNLSETMPDSKIRQTNNKNPNRSNLDSFRLKVPVRSAPTSPFESPVLSPTRPSFDLLPYNIYMAPRGNQVWSSPEIPTGASTDPISTFSSEGSPATSPPGRNIRHLSRSPNNNGSSSPFLARSSADNASSRREISATLEVHRLPLPPEAPSIHSPTPPALVFPELPLKSQWQKGKLIGRGTFGSVYVASNRETGALCAMKEVELFPDDPKSAECFKQLQQEIKVLSQLKHQNIVQYYGSEIIDDHFYIYLEYVHPGSINKYVRDHCGAITESVVRNFTRHILSGLAYLHSTKTIHRDIKGANLLVDSSGVVKLADFGMAKHLTGQAADLSLKGSPYWMAPELMQSVMQKDNNSDLALAVDIWSLGCTIIEMFTGKPPWSDYEGAAAMFKVLKDSPPIPETLSSEGKNFLQLCFLRNPAERPTAVQLLDHRFLRNSQQLDFPTKAFTGLKLMEKSFSPNVQSPKSPSTQPFGGVFASESETRRYFRNDATEIAMGSRLSPRSTLETLSSVSPPRSARHNRLRLGRIDLTSNSRLFFPSENYTLC